MPLPPALRAVYRFLNGQVRQRSESSGVSTSTCLSMPRAPQSGVSSARRCGSHIKPHVQNTSLWCEQELHMDAALDAEDSAPLHPSMLHGALGSYQFYDHVVSSSLH